MIGNQDQQSNEVKPRAYLRDVAEAAHCDVSLVSRKRKQGKSDAQIIREGVARWKRKQRDAAAGEAKQIEADAIAAPAELPADADELAARAAADLGSVTFAEAQRLKEIELYRRQKIANDESEGKLVDGAGVELAWMEIVAKVKSKLLQLPDEMCDHLATESDPIRCREMLRNKIEQCLAALSKSDSQNDD